MRELLRQEGVPDSQIWTEDHSHTTHENAVYSAELLRRNGITQIVLITDAQSMLRAELCFRKEHLTVIPAFRLISGSLESLDEEFTTLLESDLSERTHTARDPRIGLVSASRMDLEPLREPSLVHLFSPIRLPGALRTSLLLVSNWRRATLRVLLVRSA